MMNSELTEETSFSTRLAGRKIIVKIGQNFNRLTVRSLPFYQNGGRKMIVSCSCGSPDKAVTIRSVIIGETVSCGCYIKELAGKRFTDQNYKHGAYNKKHGKSTVRAWMSMVSRCYNQDNKHYKDYGGRGITVCDRWLSHNGSTYFVSDMGLKPSAKHSLDRIDNSLGYSPENCRWATPEIQSRNRRNVIVITHLGKTLCLKQWSRELGIHYQTLRQRIRRGWPLARVLEEVKK